MRHRLAPIIVLTSAAWVGGSGACRSACFDPDKPVCVERYDGTWLLVHRLRSGLSDRDVREREVDRAPALTLRGDAVLGVDWQLHRTDETWVLGFPDAGAVGVTGVPRGEGTCSAAVPRVLTYIPDDTLARQPRLQVQTPGCSGGPASSDVLFAGPSDFGREVLVWEHDEGWDLWVAAPQEGLGRGALFRFTDAASRDAENRSFGHAQMVEGPAAGDHLGEVLRRCGDLDGDGLDELAVGMPGYTRDKAFPRSGGVALFTPDALPADRDWDLEDARAVLWASADDGAGADIVCNTDVTGDGRPDLIVGAPGADGPDGANAGAVWIVAGGALTDGPLAELAAVTWHGGAPDEALGSSIATGDLDGDGQIDLAAGVPGSDAGGPASGGIRALYTLDGRPSPEPGALFAGRQILSVDGILASPRLGDRVGVADLDQDGQVELIGAAWRADRDGIRLHAGEIVGWSGEIVSGRLGGSDSDVAFRIAGSASHQEVGRVLSVTDIDNDGAIDIVTAARRRAR